MTLYELLYIIPAKYAEDEIGPVREKIKKILGKYDAKITKDDNLGKKKLTYPIKKFYQGYYILHEFELEGARINELNNQLKTTDEIIRHIIIKNPPKAEIRPAIVRKKAETPITPDKLSESTKIKKEDEKEKIKLEDLDKKLDEILDTDNLL